MMDENSGSHFRKGMRGDPSEMPMDETVRLGDVRRLGVPGMHKSGRFRASTNTAYWGKDPLFAPTTTPAAPWFNPAYDDQFRFAQTQKAAFPNQPFLQQRGKRDQQAMDLQMLYGSNQDPSVVPDFQYVPFNRFTT